MTYFKNKLTGALATFSILVLSLLVIPVFSQSTTNNPPQSNPSLITPGLNSSASSINSASEPFGADLTACYKSFDWQTKSTDERNGIKNTNPWNDKGCVTQEGFYKGNQFVKSKYSEFSVGPSETKQALGNLNIIGINEQNLSLYNQSGSLVQSVASKNRLGDNDLNDIFPQDYICKIYVSYSSNCSQGKGIPRIFFTGPNASIGNNSYSGLCKIENGVISTRPEKADSIRSLNRNPNDPATACAFPNEARVREQNLQIYQFIFEIKFLNDQECRSYYPNVDVSYCMNFFKENYGKNVIGKTDGSRLLLTYTFYGSYDDGGNGRICKDNVLLGYTGQPVTGSNACTGNGATSFNWLGWINPDVSGPRRNSTDNFVRQLDGFSAYVM